jgi:hypothetical protein
MSIIGFDLIFQFNVFLQIEGILIVNNIIDLPVIANIKDVYFGSCIIKQTVFGIIFNLFETAAMLTKENKSLKRFTALKLTPQALFV